MSRTYDWFACVPCGLGFPAYDERTLLDRFVYSGPIARCPECDEIVESHTTVTYGRKASSWEHGEG